ncbi:DNA adenine methylase [Paenibacillus enshidis]|uniref:site-specific DNA-methyltransferase (adenine-specific) n=1 Tax=Paenibacillus enshidis TaxID=1458439 RepID=A0ABV5AYP1_9BACL
MSDSMDAAVVGKTICRFCCEEFVEGSDDVDPGRLGFWCSCCEGFTYFDAENDNRKYTLLLEEKSGSNESSIGLPKVKLNKRLSPLRYPGGKSKIADLIHSYINPEKTNMLSSPFFGGGSVELALLHAGVFKKLAINDYDFGIYSLFEIIKTFPDALTLEIKSRKPTHDDFLKARDIVKKKYAACDMFEAAWSILLVNRLAFSGIYKANPLGGIKGTHSKLLARWNPEDLCKRVRTIHAMSDRYTVHNQDALEFIEEQYWDDKSTLFIDPPYVEQGKNLYLHYYEEGDHIDLQWLLDSLYKEFPCADLIVTYDDVPFIEEIYIHPDIKRIKRKFSA